MSSKTNRYTRRAFLRDTLAGTGVLPVYPR